MAVVEATTPATKRMSAGARPQLRPPADLSLDPTDLDPDTMLAVVLAQVQRRRDRVAMSVKDAQGSWNPLTWQDLQDGSNAVAAGIVHAGVAAGDRVALLAENRLEWLWVDFGAQFAGTVVVPIYASSTAEMVEQILVDSEATMVVCSTPQQAQKVNEIRGS